MPSGHENHSKSTRLGWSALFKTRFCLHNSDRFKCAKTKIGFTWGGGALASCVTSQLRASQFSTCLFNVKPHRAGADNYDAVRGYVSREPPKNPHVEEEDAEGSNNPACKSGQYCIILTRILKIGTRPSCNNMNEPKSKRQRNTEKIKVADSTYHNACIRKQSAVVFLERKEAGRSRWAARDVLLNYFISKKWTEKEKLSTGRKLKG